MTSINSVSAVILRSAGLKFGLLAIASISLLLPAAVGAQQTFSGGGAISVSSTQTTASSSTLTIAGATGSSIATINVTLSGVTSNGSSCGNCWSLIPTTFYLQAPNGGSSLVLLGSTGDGTDGDDAQDSGSGLSNVTITIQDGATAAPDGSSAIWPHTGSLTVKPSSYWIADEGSSSPLGTAIDWPQTDGSATLNGRFAGTGINNGDKWTLSIINSDGVTTPVSISGWSMTVTYATTTPTSTSVSSNLNPAFTSNTVTLTATVSTSSGTPTGTVAFTDNGATIAGCGAAVLSGGQATCNTSMPQGYNNIDAVYSGGGGYGQSSGSVTQLIEVHPAQSGNTWCNNSSFSAPLNGSPIAYPAMIPVSGYSAGSTVGNVTLELENVTEGAAGAGIEAQFLLVAPGGSNSLDFLDSAFNTEASGAVNLFISDAASLSPNYGTPVNNDTYLPFDGNTQTTESFPGSNSPIVDSSIPLVPSTINYAAPHGKTNAYTLQQAFSGAPANGDWALYATASNGSDALSVGGWCITLDVNSGVGTTTSLTSTAQKATTGSNVTLTATVQVMGSSTPVTSGTVEFEDQTTGVVLASAVALNGSGTAAVSTSTLTEGDHKIIATYSGTGSFNTSFTNMYQRIDHATAVVAESSNTWQYCNPGTITIPMGSSGAETPNPSNIFVTNLPGTLNTATLSLNNFSILVGDQLDNTESLVVGPTGSALDFFSNTAAGTIEDQAALGNYTFADGASVQVPSGSGNISPGTYKPTSYVGTDNPNDVFTADPGGFYTLPGSFGYSPARGTSTFASEFDSANPNGTWSLYFNSPNANANGTGAAGGWCVNLAENPVTVSVALSHQGDGTGNDFVQGESAALITTAVQTSDTTGPTGDPIGTNPLTVTDTLNSALTYNGFSGAGWSCSASGQQITCTNDSAIAQGASYPTLTLNVNVSLSAPASIGNSVSVSGAGITSDSGSDTIAVEAPTTTTAADTQVQYSPVSQNVTLTATVSSTGGTVNSGTVSFMVTGTGGQVGSTVTSGTVTNGLASATFTVPASTAPGTYTINAAYNPGGNFEGSSDNTHTLTINQITSTTTVTSSLNPSIFSQSVTLTATIGGSIPSGTVGFTSNGTSITNCAAVTVSSGAAQCVTSSLPVGTDAISANYSGDADNTPSSGSLSGGQQVTTLYLVVTTVNDDTGSASNCTPQTTPGTGTDSECSLRDALLYSVNAGVGNISFNASTFTSAQTIALTNGTLAIPSNTSITGATTGSGTSLANLVTVSGNNAATVFSAASGVSGSSISNLIITGGSNASGNGGGLYNDGTLAITGSTISGSTAQNGGGVYNDASGTLTITGSTLSGNQAQDGAGIANAGGTLKVYSSTISGNNSSLYAGGIADNGATTLVNTTVSGNQAALSGGGIASQNGTTSLSNSIVSANKGASSVADDIDSASGSGYTDLGGNVPGTVNGTPHLGPAVTLAALGSYGGPTRTMIPLPGSSAFCAGLSANIQLGVTTDQRGEPNANITYPGYSAGTPCVDAGSVQTNYSLAFTTEPPAQAFTGVAFSPAPVIGLSESGVASSLSAGRVVMSDTSGQLTNTVRENLTAGSAVFNELTVPTVFSDDTLTATLPISASLNITVQAATSTNVVAPTAATLTPSSGTLAASQLFTWNNGAGVTDYALLLGTTGPGSSDLYTTPPTTSTSATIAIPSGGQTVYGTLRQLIGGTWQVSRYTFTESGSPTPATLTPSSGTLAASQLFTWNNGAGPTQFTLLLGTTGPGSADLYNTEVTSATSATVSIPQNGLTVYGTLRQLIGGTWQVSRYTFTESGSPTPATLTPSSGTLAASQTFTWNNGAGPVQFALLLGTTGPGSTDIYNSQVTTATSATVSIPTNGLTVYGTLRQFIGGTWQVSSYTFTESGSPTLATLTPSSGTLAASQTFMWNNGAGPVDFVLLLGTTGQGTSDIYNSQVTTATSATVTIPTQGKTVYATLRQLVSGAWQVSRYTFTEPTPGP